MTLRDEIANVVWHGTRSIHKMDSDDIADEILALIAPELEKARRYDELGFVTSYVEPENYQEIKKKARKWDRVSSLVNGDCNSCKGFSYCEKNDIHPCEILKDALEGEVK